LRATGQRCNPGYARSALESGKRPVFERSAHPNADAGGPAWCSCCYSRDPALDRAAPGILIYVEGRRPCDDDPGAQFFFLCNTCATSVVEMALECVVTTGGASADSESAS
jgi:hypothetical protein